MIKDKFRTFQRALLYSYQAASAYLIQACQDGCPRLDAREPSVPAGQEQRVLINPNKLKQDYDDKILSIDAKEGWRPGDIFKWVGTDTYWIIYLEEKTEDAYFRGDIRRCKYRISFKDKDGIERVTWAAIRGPVETQIDSIQKNQKRIDVPNLSLNILLPKNEQTIDLFDRYDEFLFQDRCWKVQAPDAVSMGETQYEYSDELHMYVPSEIWGVLEINAEEDYINELTDDKIKELKNGLVIDPVDPTPQPPIGGIQGETFIKPGLKYHYSVETAGGRWKATSNRPIKIHTIDVDAMEVEVLWEKMVSGQFDLIWTKDDTTLTKTVVVESLF